MSTSAQDLRAAILENRTLRQERDLYLRVKIAALHIEGCTRIEIARQMAISPAVADRFIRLAAEVTAP